MLERTKTKLDAALECDESSDVEKWDSHSRKKQKVTKNKRDKEGESGSNVDSDPSSPPSSSSSSSSVVRLGQ